MIRMALRGDEFQGQQRQFDVNVQTAQILAMFLAGLLSNLEPRVPREGEHIQKPPLKVFLGTEVRQRGINRSSRSCGVSSEFLLEFYPLYNTNPDKQRSKQGDRRGAAYLVTAGAGQVIPRHACLLQFIDFAKFASVLPKILFCPCHHPQEIPSFFNF